MIIQERDLHSIRVKHKNSKIVFCLGVFDLTHVGHVLFFEECKKLGDVLVVGVGRDIFIKSYKGNSRPILNEHIRLKMVDSFKSVDYVFLDHSKIWNEMKSHEEILEPIFKNLMPQIYIVNEDAQHLEERRKIAEKNKVKMVVLPRYCIPEFENISTTKIIEKIKKLE